MAASAPDRSPPFVGALLRLCWQRVRAHLFEAVRANGFTDLQEAHFAVFSYPLPQGLRPSELARQLNASRQATNYLVGQMEALGYLERRAALMSERRLIYLTERGMQVAEVIYATLRDVEAAWAREVGPERFDDFMDVLKRLALEAPLPTRN